MAKDKSPKILSPQPQLSALTALAMPKMDLVGPTADDDIRRAISRYGADAVKEAVSNATKAKRGRKAEPDWPELREIFKAEATDWLNGIDPFAARSNYAIAKALAERAPGHSAVSTHKRIERKLSAKIGGRKWWVLHIAWSQIGAHPFDAHIRTLEALAAISDKDNAQRWQQSLERSLSVIADYEARESSPPPAEMSFHEIENAVQKSALAALLSPP